MEFLYTLTIVASLFSTINAHDETDLKYKPILGLLKQRAIGDMIAEQNTTPLTDEQKNFLNDTKIRAAIIKALSVPSRQIGYDEGRIVSYTGAKTKPSLIVLSCSCSPTLESTIESLSKNKLAHHFFIDKDGSIHAPVVDISDEDATSHRLFGTGVSGVVDNKGIEHRDCNAIAISISVIGTESNTEQMNALIQLISKLKAQHGISPCMVKDYGLVALDYGRRNVSTGINWKMLAEHDCAAWPDLKSIPNTWLNDFKEMNPRAKAFVTSMSLRKIGLAQCPITNNSENEQLARCYRQFLKLYNPELANKLAQTTDSDLFEDQGLETLYKTIIAYEEKDPTYCSLEPNATSLKN